MICFSFLISLPSFKAVAQLVFEIHVSCSKDFIKSHRLTIHKSKKENTSRTKSLTEKKIPVRIRSSPIPYTEVLYMVYISKILNLNYS